MRHPITALIFNAENLPGVLLVPPTFLTVVDTLVFTRHSMMTVNLAVS